LSDILARICADKRKVVAARKAATPIDLLEARARAADAPRGFHRALAEAKAAGRYGLICELKKASPSRGLIRPDFDPAELARAYAEGGAACLSILTDEAYFQGADEHLQAARGAVTLPCLRKDFMLDPYQIVESRAIGADCVLLIMAALALPCLRKDFMLDPYQIVESRAIGADCVLLIMAALEDGEAAELEAAAVQWGMDVLIEVHDLEELQRALRLKSPLVGINNRNLKTLEIDLATTEHLARHVGPERLLVAESGLHTPADLARMSRAGASTFLIGESLMRQDDLRAAVAALLAAPARATA
jgi:indole-3-glycerol phosphate synthase